MANLAKRGKPALARLGDITLRRTLFCVSITVCLLMAAGTAQSQTMTLDSCLALARRNNVEIRTSQMDIEQAQEVKRQAFTKFLPQVSLNGIGYLAASPLIQFGIDDIQSNDMREMLTEIYDLVSSENDVQNEVSLMKRGAAGSIVAAQPLYAGGRITTGNRLATLGIEAAELQAEMKMRDVIENIESSYYLVTGLQQKKATISAALSLIDSLDRTVQTALANGLVTRSDALQVELKRNEMLASQQQLASGIRLSKRLLCNQIGIDYSDSLVFEEPQDDTPSLLPFCYSDTGDTLRPETRLLQLNIEVEELRKRLTLGEALPQLTLIGAAYYGNTLKNDARGNAVALLSLSIPITGWNETTHKMRQHEMRIAEARLQQNHLNKMLALEEEKAYSDMVDAALLIKSDSSALEVAKESYRLATLNYQAGAATLTEVLQAHTLLLQAQNAITDRHTTYIVARRRLLDLRRTQLTND